MGESGRYAARVTTTRTGKVDGLLTITPWLALAAIPWQWPRMTSPPPREPRAAGGLMAMAILAGVVIGSILGQPTIGFLVGAAIGVGLLVTFWVIDRGR